MNPFFSVNRNTRCKIIAELGTLHLHSKKNAKFAVAAAFNAGADFVKLQCINPLTAFWATNEQRTRYESIEWPVEEWQEFLDNMNYTHKKPVFVSVFEMAHIKALDRFVPCWKVAFRMKDNEELISEMLWTKKPIFFSTNERHWHTHNEKHFMRNGIRQEQFIRLFCTPYRIFDTCLPLLLLNRHQERYDGVSFNFGGKQVLTLAKYLGLCTGFMEIHVKATKPEGPDASWSLTLKELERLRHELGD